MDCKVGYCLKKKNKSVSDRDGKKIVNIIENEIPGVVCKIYFPKRKSAKIVVASKFIPLSNEYSENSRWFVMYTRVLPTKAIT